LHLYHNAFWQLIPRPRINNVLTEEMFTTVFKHVKIMQMFYFSHTDLFTAWCDCSSAARIGLDILSTLRSRTVFTRNST